jgi:hypothetical protein
VPAAERYRAHDAGLLRDIVTEQLVQIGSLLSDATLLAAAVSVFDSTQPGPDERSRARLAPDIRRLLPKSAVS